MRIRRSFISCVCLAVSIPPFGPLCAGGLAGPRQQQSGTAGEASDQDKAEKKAPDGKTAPKKSPGRGKTTKKKTERGGAKAAERNDGLEMEPGIVCKSIDGYEDYEPLPDAAQTAEEKLLVYVRMTGFQTEKVDKGYQVHLTVDGEVRKRGTKPILRQKKKLVEFKPVTTYPLNSVYLKNAVSLKGLAPGEYDLTIIIHDELLTEDAPVSQVVKFKVIPPLDPQKVNEADPPKS